jgi:hypothetical protein
MRGLGSHCRPLFYGDAGAMRKEGGLDGGHIQV